MMLECMAGSALKIGDPHRAYLLPTRVPAIGITSAKIGEVCYEDSL
jgi:hypothetical protein